MIKLSLKILAIIFLFIFQITIFNKLVIFGSVPNLIFILSIAFLLKNRFNDALIVAIGGGLLLDLVSPLSFGVYTILFLGILFILNFVILRMLPAPNLLWLYIIFSGAFLLIDLLILLFVRVWPSWMIVGNVLINGLWGILVYLFLVRLVKPMEEIKIE